MPINMSIGIIGSVGSKGKNAPADVSTVQRRLNELMHPPRVRLIVDGKSGRKTRAMIRDFQRCVCGFRWPDGRVDPAGATIMALNNPASEGKWAQMSIPPEPAPTPSGGGGGGGGSGNKNPDAVDDVIESLSQHQRAVYDRLQAEIAKKPGNKEAEDFLDELATDYLPIFKDILNSGIILQYSAEFVEALANLRRLGFTGRDIAQMLKLRISNRTLTIDDWIKSSRALASNAVVKRALTALGKATLVLAVAIAMVDVANHFRHGRIGPGMAEVYGLLMGIAVPWAGAVNAAQSLLYEHAPQMRNPRVDMAFRVILALDPIGAGKFAVDTAYTLIAMLGELIIEGKVQPGQIDALVKRMRNSPMRLWTDLGDDLGDWLGDTFGEWAYEKFFK